MRSNTPITFTKDELLKYSDQTTQYFFALKYRSYEKYRGATADESPDTPNVGSVASEFLTDVIVAYQKNRKDGTSNPSIDGIIAKLQVILAADSGMLQILNGDVHREEVKIIVDCVTGKGSSYKTLTQEEELFTKAFSGLVERSKADCSNAIKAISEPISLESLVTDDDPHGIIFAIVAGLTLSRGPSQSDESPKTTGDLLLNTTSHRAVGVLEAQTTGPLNIIVPDFIMGQSGKEEYKKNLLSILGKIDEARKTEAAITIQGNFRAHLGKGEAEIAKQKKEKEEELKKESELKAKKESDEKEKARKKNAYNAKLVKVFELGIIKQISGQELVDHNGMEINLYRGAAGYNAFSTEVENARKDEGNLSEAARAFKTKGGESGAAYSMVHLRNVPYLGGGDAYAIVVKHGESTTANFFASKAQFDSALTKQKEYYDEALREITEEGQEYYNAEDEGGKKEIMEGWKKYARKAAAAKFFEEDVKKKLDNKEPNISSDDAEYLAAKFADAQGITLFSPTKSERSRMAVKRALEVKSPDVKALSPGISITGFPGAQHQYTAHVTFTPNASGEYEGHDIAYVKLPNTSQCYRRVQVAPADGWNCRIVENGKLVNKTFDKGEIIPGTATICHFDSKTGAYKEYDTKEKFFGDELTEHFGEEEAKNIRDSYNKLTIVAVSNEYASVIQGNKSSSINVTPSLGDDQQSVASGDGVGNGTDHDYDMRSQDSAELDLESQDSDLDNIGDVLDEDGISQDSAEFTYDWDIECNAQLGSQDEVSLTAEEAQKRVKEVTRLGAATTAIGRLEEERSRSRDPRGRV